MRILDDIEKPGLTKAQVLALIPDLPPKLFMNWSEAGLIDLRVQGNRRLLSGLSVIKLAAMTEVVKSGMRPPEAAAFANKIKPRIFELRAALPDVPDASERKVLPLSTILYVEADLLILTMLARLHRLDNGQPLDAPTAKKARRK